MKLKVDFGNGLPSDNILLQISSTGAIELHLYYGTAVGYQMPSSQNLNIGTWYHLTFTYSNAGVISFYTNGIQTGTKAAVQLKSVIRANNYIGKSAWQTYGDAYINALFDEIKIFNAALNSTQIISEMKKLQPNAI